MKGEDEVGKCWNEDTLTSQPSKTSKSKTMPSTSIGDPTNEKWSKEVLRQAVGEKVLDSIFDEKRSGITAGFMKGIYDQLSSVKKSLETQVEIDSKILCLKLHPHQKMAISWMKYRESLIPRGGLLGNYEQSRKVGECNNIFAFIIPLQRMTWD